MKYKYHVLKLIAGGWLIMANVVQAASPPTLMTPEEELWKKVSLAAGRDRQSDETLKLMNQFFKKYTDHPKSIALRYLFAERDFNAEHHQQAAVGYEKFLRLFPKHALSDSVAYRLGECYYNLKIFNSAASAWDRVVKEYPTSALVPNAMEQLGLLHMRSNEWGKADEMFKSLKSRYPDYALYDRMREAHGIVQYQFKEYDFASNILSGVDSPRAQFYRGLSLFSLKLFEEAVAALNEASRAVGGSFAEQAAFLKAESFFQKKNYPLAGAEFSSFLKRYPASPLAMHADLRKAACSYLMGENTDAIYSANKIIDGKPGLVAMNWARFIKAGAQLRTNRMSEAVALFSQVADIKETPELSAAALLNKAWAQRCLGDDSGAEKSLLSFKERHPGNPRGAAVLYLQGALLFEKGKWEDAGTHFQQAVHGYPYSSISEAGLAMMTVAYLKADRKDSVVTAGNSALKLFEKNFSSESLYWRPVSYFNIGKAYESLGRYKEALPFFEKVAIKSSDHTLAPDAQLRYAWCLSLTGSDEKAREKAKELVENPKIAKPLAVNAAFLVAATYFNAKNYDQALVLLADFLKANPTDGLAPRARYMMGLSYHQKKVYGSAIDEWNKLIQEHPSHPLSQDAYLQTADLYFKSNDYDKAADTFAKFRDKWPSSPYTEMALWQELQSYFNGKADEKAIRVYPLYINRQPVPDNVANGQNQLEMIYYRRGSHGDPDKLQEFLSKYPKSPFAPSARYKLGDMAIEQKQWTRAASEMEQFVRDHPKDTLFKDALYGLGIAYENLGETEKAIVQYRQLMTQFADKPGAIDGAFRLGSLHFKKERYKEASDAFEFASKKKMPEDLRANVWNNLALCYENTGRLLDAAVAYGNVAKYTKEKAAVRDALLSAGLLMKKAEQPAKAVSYFDLLLKDAGDSKMELQVINLLAESYRGMGRAADAIRTYEKLISVEPPSEDLRLAGLAQLAYLYEQKKDIEKAIRIYEKIAVSEGKQEWVKAAQDRITQLAAVTNALP